MKSNKPNEKEEIDSVLTRYSKDEIDEEHALLALEQYVPHTDASALLMAIDMQRGRQIK